MTRNFRLLSVALLLYCFGARAQVSVIGELSNDKDANPGERYEGVITVRNDATEPQEVKVYQTDYMFFRDGTNNYAEPGTVLRSNAKWISFSPSFTIVPPQSTVNINYTVTVPQDAPTNKLAGSYWSMLMVEGIAKGSAESAANKDPKKAQMGIRQTIRYGIQIATHIAQTGTKKINFMDTKLLPNENGKRILQIDIENSGELWIRPEVYVELFDDKGVSKGKFPGVRYRLYPGTSIRQMIDLSSVGSGTYKAIVVVDAGGEDVYGAEYTLKF
ncbi:MAG: hypothetical protein HW389_3153 [Bacteroidetes bacterium]|nr:hypothetical protein [Bacteroidota bacterium]MBM2841204.1 hypothetical protein [Bacteroidota bacterium]